MCVCLGVLYVVNRTNQLWPVSRHARPVCFPFGRGSGVFVHMCVLLSRDVFHTAAAAPSGVSKTPDTVGFDGE